MLQLGAISHPNPLIDKKVKFFHDCFHYYLLDNAKKIDGFPENHLTYLERMLFRVETLSKMHQSSRKAICFWLEQPEFDTEIDSYSKLTSIKPLVLQLKQISSQIGDNFDLKLFHETATQIVDELNGVDGLNGSIYFYEVLKSQISLISCEHELEEHSDEIMRNARWLVAEYLRLGFDEKDLTGFNSVFKRIMRFGELKTSKKPHSVGFPLPLELREKRNTRKFKGALNRYLENNSFVTQFEGMLNALKETQNGDIYFRVNGIRKHGEGEFGFTYAGVSLFTAEKIPFESFKFHNVIKKDFENFFNAPNTVIAKVPMLFKSKEQALSIAKFQANRALDALRYVLDGSGGSVSTNRIIIAWSNGGADYRMNGIEDLKLNSLDLDRLLEFEKTIPYPSNITLEVRKYLDQCSRIFFKGLSCENPDDIVSHFWQYWETSFAFYIPQHRNELKKAEYIIENLGLVLSNGSYLNSKMWIGLLIFNYAINNTGNEEIGIPSSFYGSNFDFKNPDQTVQEVKKFSNYPLLKILMEKFDSIDSTIENLRWQKFYTGFLWQLYEQRNFILHDGTYCPATLERLKFLFRSIVVRWQTKLFDELEKDPNYTVQKAIEQLIANSKVT